MKTSILSVLALSFGLLAQGGTAFAAEEQPRKAAPKMKSSAHVPSGTSLPNEMYKPVPKMNIAKGSSPKALKGPSVASSSRAIPTFDPIISDLDAFKRAGTVYHEARIAFAKKAPECWSRDYTQADQAAAGCRATETVSVCYEKLATYCITPVKVRRDNARTALTGAHNKLKNTINGYMSKL